MSRSPTTLVGAGIAFTGDLGSAGAAIKVDDILDAMPMSSGTSYATFVAQPPP
jgi:hypothetical protein